MNQTDQLHPLVAVEKINQASHILESVIKRTDLCYNKSLSQKYEANIYLKREDLQVIRSYKIRGAYNKIQTLTRDERKQGVICASAGNHAQGVALACKLLKIDGKIIMPTITPQQKYNRVVLFGEDYVEVILEGDTFDDAYIIAERYRKKENRVFIEPFDDINIIEGQGTLGKEIIEQINSPIDYVIVPIGGGGLISGVGSYIKQCSPQTEIIGVEPSGAPSMKASLDAGKVVTLDKIDKFVDGAAVKTIGKITFDICKQILNYGIIEAPEGLICATILELYTNEGIVVEPAGALSVSALQFCKEQIKGKTVVCIISGSNNDIGRLEEIKERALLYQQLKHYFIIQFPQRPRALREFLDRVLGKNDDIVFFEYAKKINKEIGPALVGIELKTSADYIQLIKRMNKYKIKYQVLNGKPNLFNLLIS